MQAQLPIFPEYEFFSNLKFDAITLGNHEFDGKDDGFLLLMKKASQLGAGVPIVSTNLILPDKRKLPIVKSLIKDLKGPKGSVRVGLLGALGPDGCAVSQANREGITFVGHDDSSRKAKWDDLINLLSQESNKLREKGAELIVLLLHGGGEEDERLAKEVEGLDVIIAGHTHESYFKEVGGVYVAQAGSYGRFLGEMTLLKGSNDKWKLLGQKRLPITSTIPKDDDLEKRLNTYDKFLSKLDIFHDENFRKEKVVFQRDFFKDDQGSLGKIVTDNILSSLNEGISNKVDLYLSVRGLLRVPLYAKLPYTKELLFNVLPLGFHEGGRPGYRSTSFYVTKKELENLIEFLYLYSKFKPKSYPVHSRDLSYDKKSWGVPFLNRYSNFKIKGKPLPKLVHVATNTFLFSYLDLISKKTFGLIEIRPRNEKGEVVSQGKLHDSEISFFLKGTLR